MGTNNLRLWKQIEPELYVHATCRDTISSELQISSLREFSAAAARVSFNEYFGEELDFEISIEEGSLKLRIVATISGVLIILSQYGNIRSGLDYLCNDVRKVLEYVKKPIIESEYISDPIRVERRLGVVGRVDKTLLDYQKGRITLEECRERLIRYFEIIYESPHGKDIADAMIAYNDTKHQDSTPWKDFKRNIDRYGIVPRNRNDERNRDDETDDED
jgi:hypothetical protein